MRGGGDEYGYGGYGGSPGGYGGPGWQGPPPSRGGGYPQGGPPHQAAQGYGGYGRGGHGAAGYAGHNAGWSGRGGYYSGNMGHQGSPGGSGRGAAPLHLDRRKVFVGGLPASVTEMDFRSYFARYGVLVDCVVMMDRETGRSRGFGFVTYDQEPCADSVLAEKHMLHGKIVDCKRAEPKVEQVVAAGGVLAPHQVAQTSVPAGAPPAFPPSAYTEQWGGPRPARGGYAPGGRGGGGGGGRSAGHDHAAVGRGGQGDGTAGMELSFSGLQVSGGDGSGNGSGSGMDGQGGYGVYGQDMSHTGGAGASPTGGVSQDMYVAYALPGSSDGHGGLPSDADQEAAMYGGATG